MFWRAFHEKLLPVMKPEAQALDFIERVMQPSHAVGAVASDGTLIGVAGFKTKHGAFIGGGLEDLQSVYGWFGGAWRGLLLSVLERPLQDDTLTMDGVMVSAEARGRGVGTALLLAIKNKARDLGCAQVRLDVVDTNPRAKALYERQGFACQGASSIGPLRHLFGFRSATMMICNV
ncbi:MAG: GNAT family N-acetyltransferase [Neomegalonema sp.]|nr:GNAT family N-acetyltransferase [Neomegalonema sp.]